MKDWLQIAGGIGAILAALLTGWFSTRNARKSQYDRLKLLAEIREKVTDVDEAAVLTAQIKAELVELAQPQKPYRGILQFFRPFNWLTDARNRELVLKSYLFESAFTLVFIGIAWLILADSDPVTWISAGMALRYLSILAARIAPVDTTPGSVN